MLVSRTKRVGFAAVLGVAATMILSGTPARATVVDRGSFEFSETVPDPFCGLNLVRATTATGSFRIRLDKASDGQAFLQRLNLDTRDVFTNTANGKTMTFEGHSLINEVRATHVSGNVYEFTTVEAGQPFVVRDGAGNVVLRDRGVLRHRVLFDTQGDGMPGGVTLDDQIVAISGPHPGFDQTEEQFCAMVVSLVG